MDSHDFVVIFTVLNTAVVLPISIVFLSLRRKIESEKIKKEIAHLRYPVKGLSVT